MTETAAKKEPFQEVLSKNVTVFYGYKDGHATIRVRTPVGIFVSVDVSIADIAKVKEHFDLAWAWRNMTDAERKGKEPVEVLLRSDAKVKYRFKDLHVELGIWRVVWIWLTFPDDEFALAKKAFENAYGWSILPKEVRELQGIAA